MLPINISRRPRFSIILTINILDLCRMLVVSTVILRYLGMNIFSLSDRKMLIYLSKNKELYFCPKTFKTFIVQYLLLDYEEIHFIDDKCSRTFDRGNTCSVVVWKYCAYRLACFLLLPSNRTN